MTAAASNVEALLRSSVLEVVEDWTMLRRAHRLFLAALQDEKYEAIRSSEADLDFWVKGMAIRASERALAEGDEVCAQQLNDWVRNGIPRSERDRIVALLTK